LKGFTGYSNKEPRAGRTCYRCGLPMTPFEAPGGCLTCAREESRRAPAVEWVAVEDGLPPAAGPGWLTFDGDEIRVERCRPCYWNRPGAELAPKTIPEHNRYLYAGPVVTHWAPLPESPARRPG
jgi:hypothetical protein